MTLLLRTAPWPTHTGGLLDFVFLHCFYVGFFPGPSCFCIFMSNCWRTAADCICSFELMGGCMATSGYDIPCATLLSCWYYLRLVVVLTSCAWNVHLSVRVLDLRPSWKSSRLQVGCSPCDTPVLTRCLSEIWCLCKLCKAWHSRYYFLLPVVL